MSVEIDANRSTRGGVIMAHATKQSALLSSRQAASILGVHTASVKRWSDQGVLRCVRTPGGHRRFHRRDIEALRGHPTGAHAEFSERLWSAARNGEQMRAEGELLQYWGQVGRWEHVSDAIGAMLVSVGQAWADGQVSISEEHIATETLRRSMARLLMMMPLRPDAPVCALATVPNDEHTIGLAMSELVLAEHDWKSLWLGRNTPMNTIVEVINRPDVDMVALSASEYSCSPTHLANFLAAIGPLARRRGTHLILGGTGAWPDPPSHAHRVRSFRDFGLLLRGDLAARTLPQAG